MRKKMNSRFCCSCHVVFAAVMLLLSFPFAAQAQQNLSVEDLVGMLQNRAPAESNARSLTPEELERRQQNRIVVERAGSTRDITVTERRKLAKIVRENGRPSVDMEIFFRYDSAAITPKAVPVLIRLGQALSDNRLAGSIFMIAGHTDARGASDYNQRLSQRRAQSVKQFLVTNFGIEPRRLIAVGYGEEQLKNPYNPEAAENRRVQIVNMSNAMAGR